jgi:hypothetical protein
MEKPFINSLSSQSCGLRNSSEPALLFGKRRSAAGGQKQTEQASFDETPADSGQHIVTEQRVRLPIGFTPLSLDPTHEPDVTEESAGKRTHRLVILRRFAQLAKAFFLYGTRHETRVFVVLLLILSAVVGLTQLLVSYAGRNFITSLTQRDTAGFYRNLWVYLGTFAIAIPVGVFYRYCAERLALLWRLWMTHISWSAAFSTAPITTGCAIRTVWTTPTSASRRMSGRSPPACSGICSP